ncbi:stage V sporulation protein AA [Mobilisporobacter senegalensis]|uniref:Stage V sporulation protein AA n=1 Tax=Mobilisporobacter senegalensis TaxID=1329262 RepID=A0A3N1XMD6_9FIRM|nr:stage V sporulation protein AA [Mobilisporobacter senegalensis]ROR27311.1 stage V sporulation protein AA [Mobilisporobacter senegalensis]
MKNDIVYMKIPQNIEIQHQKVLLSDLAKLVGVDKRKVNNIGNIEVFNIKSKKDCKYIFSVMKIIEFINKSNPEIEIVNLGEKDFVVEYKIPTKTKVMFEYIKSFFVALIIFFGAAFTIMTFNTDVSVDKVFAIVYELVMGEAKKGGTILEISYSIGLPIGIIIFFNHFSRLKVRDDPTPIQIEMRLYEDDLNNALIQDASREGTTIDAD